MKVRAGSSGWSDGRLVVATLKHDIRLMKIEWEEIQLELVAEETEVEPKVYSDIPLAYEIAGEGLNEARLSGRSPWPRSTAPFASCSTRHA
ncbi:MAG: hypothetical protein ACE5KQ_00665 [Thermoplasmata archaeon]